MYKTIKQIADDLKIDKQKVYRFIKSNHINEVHHEAHQTTKVKHYDEVAQKLIYKHFENKTTSQLHQNYINEAHQTTSKSTSKSHQNNRDEVVELLKKQLEEKNKEIERLQSKVSEKDKLIAEISIRNATTLSNASYQNAIETMNDNQKQEVAEETQQKPKKKHWWQSW